MVGEGRVVLLSFLCLFFFWLGKGEEVFGMKEWAGVFSLVDFWGGGVGREGRDFDLVSC